MDEKGQCAQEAAKWRESLARSAESWNEIRSCIGVRPTIGGMTSRLGMIWSLRLATLWELGEALPLAGVGVEFMMEMRPRP